MQRTARFRLWRLSPPFCKTVEVQRITVGGFLELVRAVAPRVAGKMVAAGGAISDTEFIRSAADASMLSAAADLLCRDQSPRFLHRWLDGRLNGAFAYRNTAAFLRACREAEGSGQWTRFLGCLNRTPEKGERKAKGGGLMADVMVMSGMIGTDPMTILGWPLQDFLTLCDSINLVAQETRPYDPTADPDAEPASADALYGMVH